jgi:hypothetical protein
MNWIMTYESYLYEAAAKAEVSKLEKVLGLPAGSGVFRDVFYDKSDNTLYIEQPNDLNPMDSGAVIAAVNSEKSRVKKEYSGIKRVAIGDLQITII